MLILNVLRLIVTCLFSLASPCIFHCSRHTAATMLLTLGASIYVVSKILGHKSIKMTEVYAKIVDKKKLETVNLVNGMFDQTQIAI